MSKPNKIITAEQAALLVPDGANMAMTGFVGAGIPEELAIAIENRFLKTGHPRDLTLFYCAGQGDSKDRGTNHYGHEGLLRRVIGGHWGLVPKLQKLALTGKIQAYNLPQGVLANLFRDIASGRPGLITEIGLNTFVDPRNGGGKLNSITTEDLVRLMPIDGKEYLFYKALPLQVGILRGTTADLDGNISMEREALTMEMLAVAMAVHNSGGVVIAQVERIAERGTLHPKSVKIPGIFVDAIVVAQPQYHHQTLVVQYNPAYSGEIRAPLSSIPPMEMSERKVIARRASLELAPNTVVNLGIGMPEGIANVSIEERISDFMTLTAEPGVIGGVPASGLNFGCSVNAQAVIDQPDQFCFYDGGGLHATFLGLAQADQCGNVNVSKFGPRLAGAGGFINISQSARKVIFVGTFTASPTVEVKDGQIVIVKESPIKKFVRQVEHLTFSGEFARRKGTVVLYITERAVFTPSPSGGLILAEIAPGIVPERDIYPHMEFMPEVPPGGPKLMDPRIFAPGPMGLYDDLLNLPLSRRFAWEDDRKLAAHISLENFNISSLATLHEIRTFADGFFGPVGRKVRAIVNYENVIINPAILTEFVALIKDIQVAYFSSAVRYTKSVFLRMKLDEVLSTVPGHIPTVATMKEAETRFAALAD